MVAPAWAANISDKDLQKMIKKDAVRRAAVVSAKLVSHTMAILFGDMRVVCLVILRLGFGVVVSLCQTIIILCESSPRPPCIITAQAQVTQGPLDPPPHLPDS